MISFHVDVNGKEIGVVDVINIGHQRGDSYLYEAHLDGAQKPFVTFSHKRSLPYGKLMERIGQYLGDIQLEEEK